MTKEITLNLTIDETNAVLGALSKFPYEQVKSLIEKIHEQGSPQAAAIMEEAKVEESIAESEGGEA